MSHNPWQVDSIEAFSFLKCPECVFDTQGEDIFQNHAIERHPLSILFFASNVKVGLVKGSSNSNFVHTAYGKTFCHSHTVKFSQKLLPE